MNFTLPKFYPITDTRLRALSHAEQVEKMAGGGAKIVQLRDKFAAPDEFYAGAQKAIEIARRENVKIIINDRVDIALALKADGVHLGQDDLPPAEARKLLGNDLVIGFSTHNIEQVRDAIRQPIDYIAFGPIFPTSTKENPDPVVGLSQLSEIKQMVGNIPLVAIGGINSVNYGEVFKAGADSVAFISGFDIEAELPQ